MHRYCLLLCENLLCVPQALKANPERAPKELKANANYISTFGQTALNDALDMVYDVSGGREITITL